MAVAKAAEAAELAARERAVRLMEEGGAHVGHGGGDAAGRGVRLAQRRERGLEARGHQ